MGFPSAHRARRNGSSVNPRTYIKQDDNGRTLTMVRCPFCHKAIEPPREPFFRNHLHKRCEEAPREVNRDASDWQEEPTDEMAEFMLEEEAEEESEEDSDRPDDAPGEVLPV